MSWQIEMTTIVRNIINDTAKSPTYTDIKIQELIVVAAQLIKREIDFENTYTMDVTELSIAPDPTTPYRDDGFINLVSLKCALMMLASELKTYAAQSIRVSDASSSIDMSGAYRASKDLYDTLSEDYQAAKFAYQAGNLNAIRAILTPYTQTTSGGGFIFG